MKVAGWALGALCAESAALAQTADTPSTAAIRERLKDNMTRACIASAKEKGATESRADGYCRCVSAVVDTMDDTEFLDLVETEARKERPKNATFVRIIETAQTCGAASGKAEGGAKP